MGQAKRRGTFEERKAQKLASQYGLTNRELAEAYIMNKRYNLAKRISKTKIYQLTCYPSIFHQVI